MTKYEIHKLIEQQDPETKQRIWNKIQARLKEQRTMLNDNEVKKVSTQLKDFSCMPKLHTYDLFYYDKNIYKKLQNPKRYKKVLEMTLDSSDGPTVFGGKNIIVYLSADKKHYVYQTYTWGD